MAAKDDFTLDDFRKQFDQLEKMGPMKDLLGNMPGMSEMIPEGEEPEAAFKRIRSIIDAMTEEERRDPDGIDLSHRRRIAAESGTDPEEVEQFLEQFKQVRKLMRIMRETSVWQRIKLVCGFGRLNGNDKE
jgi:signal recognition particle subunit SRP54